MIYFESCVRWCRQICAMCSVHPEPFRQRMYVVYIVLLLKDDPTIEDSYRKQCTITGLRINDGPSSSPPSGTVDGRRKSKGFFSKIFGSSKPEPSNSSPIPNAPEAKPTPEDIKKAEAAAAKKAEDDAKIKRDVVVFPKYVLTMSVIDY